LLSAVLYALSFPKSPLFFLGFFFLIPLLYRLEKERKERAGQNSTNKKTSAFRLFFFFAFVSYVLILYWIPGVMVNYGGMSPPLSIMGIIVLAAFLSLFHGLSGILIRRAYLSYPLLHLLMIPLIWISRDLVIEKIFGGFPWCLAGYSQYKNTFFAQLAEIGGIHLISFLLIFLNILIFRLIFSRGREKRIVVALAVTLVSIYTVGFYLHRSASARSEQYETHKAGIIQPNTSNDRITRREKLVILNRLLEESEELAARGAEFIIWPEHTIHIYPLQSTDYRRRIYKFVNANVPLLAGFTDMQSFSRIYNSAVLFEKIDSAATLNIDNIQKYDKVHLTPFGEYILFRKLLFFVKRITDEIADFSPGSGVHNLTIYGHNVSVPICYEIIFPELVRDFVSRNGELLVTISNDSWFGDTSAPFQHLSMAVFRCIENRRYLLRSTTNGISAVVSPTGEIRYTSDYDTSDHFIGEFKYLDYQTFFTRYGYLFPYFCAVLLLLFYVIGFITSRKNR
jgi:apolipoprotein N-acyltransferase